jgi:SagB-type dehydrogenase family enzyme
MTAPAALYECPLPKPVDVSPLGRLLAGRRSVRAFGTHPLALEHLGELLWAAQGVTDPEGLRTAPSAGALYPLEIFVVAGRVTGLPGSVYRYLPQGHALRLHKEEDLREALAAAAYHQDWLKHAATVLAIAAVFGRTAGKYGERATRFVPMEAGHAGQNLLLQAEALDLAAVVVGAFEDREVAAALGLPADMTPLSLVPVGPRPGQTAR